MILGYVVKVVWVCSEISYLDISTKDLAKQSQQVGQSYGIYTSNDGRVMIFAGG